MNRNRILFIKVSDSSFINEDEKLLKRHFEVETYFYGTETGMKAGVSMVKMILFLLFNIRKFSTLYIWFADYHSLIPSFFSYLFNKKIFIVLGGFDVAKIPDLNYGAHVSRIRSLFIRASCHFANGLIAVSEYVKGEAEKQIGKKIIQKTKVIYNAVDLSVFRDVNELRENQVLYVSAAEDKRRAQIKGIDRLIEIAVQVPEYQFLLIGVSDLFIEQKMGLSIPNNIQIFPFLKKDDLLELYNKSKVVLQLSVIESFGLAVVEAMACACVPVVSDVGGLKEIVNNNLGYTVDRTSDQQIIASIKDALYTYDVKSIQSKKSVQERFSISIREKQILDFISGVCF